jgi:hypothetical protein
MGKTLRINRCSQCGSRFVEGEMVGVDELDGRQKVLCCLCLDLRTSRLGVVRHRNGRVEIQEPRAVDLPARAIRPA